MGQNRYGLVPKRLFVSALVFAVFVALFAFDTVQAGLMDTNPVLSLESSTHILDAADPFYNTTMNGTLTIGQIAQEQWLWVEVHANIVVFPGGVIDEFPIHLQHTVLENYDLSVGLTLEMNDEHGSFVGNAYAFKEGKKPPQIEPVGGAIDTLPLADPRPTPIIIYGYSSPPIEVGSGSFSLAFSNWLIYDQGDKDEIRYVDEADDRLAVRFSPSPKSSFAVWQIKAINLTLGSFLTRAHRFGLDITVDGPVLIAGEWHATIASLPTQSFTAGSWVTVNTTEYGIFVSGDFYVEFAPKDPGIQGRLPGLYADTEPGQPWLISNRSYYREDGVWHKDMEHEYLIRALVERLPTRAVVVSAASGEFAGSIDFPEAVDRVEVVGTRNIADYELSLDPIRVSGQMQTPWLPGWLGVRIHTAAGGIRDVGTWVQPEGEAWTWQMSRHDESNQAFSPSTAPNTNRIQWNTTISGTQLIGTPTAADGKVFVTNLQGTIGGSVYALDASDGDIIWSKSFGVEAIIFSSPVYYKSRLYFASYSLVAGDLYALDAATGEVIWSHEIGPRVHATPTVAAGVVYIGSGDYQVHAFNAVTGAEEWSYATGAHMGYHSPAVAEGRLFVPGCYGKTGNLYAFNASTGSKLWNYTTSGNITGSPAAAGGKVYFGTFDGAVFCLNASDGQYAWSYIAGNGPLLTSPAVAYDKVYIGSNNSNVYALNADTGAFQWRYKTPGAVGSSPSVADNKVYTMAVGWLLALDASNGGLNWRRLILSTPESHFSVAYGNAYIGTTNMLYCFGPNHDYLVPRITIPKTVIGQGYSTGITVTLQNMGDITERFNLELHYNGMIDELPITLEGGIIDDFPIHWVTTFVDKGNYTISALAWPTFGETNISNNMFVGSWVAVTVPGDVKFDKTVNILDLILIANHLGHVGGDGHTPYSPDWYSCMNTDIQGDNAHNVLDLIICANHLGQNW